MVLAIPILEFTAFTPVRLGLTMPAVNGLVGLPLIALYFSPTNGFSIIRAGCGRISGVIVLLMFVLAVLTAQGLSEQILRWI